MSFRSCSSEAVLLRYVCFGSSDMAQLAVRPSTQRSKAFFANNNATACDLPKFELRKLGTKSGCEADGQQERHLRRPLQQQTFAATVVVHCLFAFANPGPEPLQIKLISCGPGMPSSSEDRLVPYLHSTSVSLDRNRPAHSPETFHHTFIILSTGFSCKVSFQSPLGTSLPGAQRSCE